MNARIRRVGAGIVALFVVLAAQVSYLQVVANDRLANHPENVRAIVQAYSEPRGPILTAEEVIVARSEAVDDEFEFRRRYPTGELFGHVSGMFSFSFGASGVEAFYNDELTGDTEDLQFGNIGDLLIGKEHTGTVVLSLRADAQDAARQALDGRAGSVVALDPTSGAVLTMYSEPSYDPEPLAAHDQSSVQEVFEALEQNEANPRLPRAWRERYPPGSTFKIVTASIALEEGVAEPDTEYPSISELDLPLTDRVLRNFGGSTCGGTLAESLRRSCNTTFGQIGLDLGDDLAAGVEEWGIGDDVPLDLTPQPVESTGPEAGAFERNQPLFAQAAIGQTLVDVTPLQMAMITGGIANGGEIMAPHVMTEVRDIDGAVVDRFAPRVWKRPISPRTAEQVTEMMVAVVASGTGTRAQISGVEVAGKTGTAQTGDDPDGEERAPHAWFVAFAPADDPRVAIAVLVEEGGDLGSEATGGRVAAPIAKTVLEVLLSDPAPETSE